MRSAKAELTAALTVSRLPTRSALVAIPGASGSRPNAVANFCHRPWLPTAICSIPSRQLKRPYGVIEGWWLPWAWGTSPATVYRVPWKACTPTIAASRLVRTTRPRPVACRSCSAATTPYAPYMPASRSPIGTPTRVGWSGSGPVSDISPASPCAIWS